MGPVVRRWFVLLGVVTSALGLLVFFAPREAGGVWPWAQLAAWKTLDSRLVASMLLTVGVGGLHITLRNSRTMATVFVPMLVGYCTVAVAGLIIHATDTPALRRDDWTYVGGLATVATTTAVPLLRERAQSHQVSWVAGLRPSPNQQHPAWATALNSRSGNSPLHRNVR